jgi:hypothetical protein
MKVSMGIDVDPNPNPPDILGYLWVYTLYTSLSILTFK